MVTPIVIVLHVRKFSTEKLLRSSLLIREVRLFKVLGIPSGKEGKGPRTRCLQRRNNSI